MSKIKVILSDFDGVMVNRFTESSVNDFCAKYGKTDFTPSDFNKISADAVMGLDVGKKNKEEYFRELIHGLHLKMTVKKMLEYFAEADMRNMRRNEQFVEWLENVGKRGIVVGVASNVSKDLFERLNNGGFYDIFRERFFSYKIGATKSEEKFWRYVLDDLAVKPEAIIFIDDNQNNVDAARAAGIRGFLYTNFSQLTKDVSYLINF
jgi:putative hydrolase of the HAD superfamily